jgi:uncharacterized caspase-like protein
MSLGKRLWGRSCGVLLGGLLAFSGVRPVQCEDTAILIGVDLTDSTAVRDLQYAGADAKLLQTTLVRGGFPESGIVCMTDQPKDGSLTPRLEHVRRELQARLAAMSESDRLIIFFGGHATAVDQEWVFVPADFDRESPVATGFRFSELREWLQGCRAKHQLLLLDCCRSPLEGDGEIAGANGADQPLFDVFAGLPTTVIAGCRPGQKCYEALDRQHGYLTLAVAEALQGRANRATEKDPGDDVVDTVELVSYVPHRVRELALSGAEPREQEAAVDDFDAPGSFALTRVVTDSGSADVVETDAGFRLLTTPVKLLLLASAIFGLWWFVRGFRRRIPVVRQTSGRERGKVG